MKRFLSVLALCLGLAPVVMAAGVDLNQHGLTGSWYEPASGGQGVELEVFPNMSSPGTGYAFMSWFTYDTFVGGAERQRWYTVEGPVVTGQPNATLTIYQNTGGNFNAPPTTTAHPVGTATLSFDSCTTGLLSYSFADGTGRTGSIPLTRLTQSMTCSTIGAPLTNTDFSLSGNWYDPATSGQGITVEVNAGSKALFLAWYTFAPNGAGAGPAGQRWYTAQAEFTPNLRSMPVTIYQTTGGVFDTPTPPGQKTVQVGTGTMAFQSCSAATLSYHFTGGSSSGASGTIALTRVGPVPPGCAVLAAPSNLVATVVSGRSVYSINLTWTDNSSNETGFKIERSASPSSGFQEIATVGANVTTYSITGTSAPPPPPTYFRVRAYNTGADSAYSNIASVSTDFVSPNAPSGLTAGSATSSSLTLTWTDNSSNETGFKIERSTSPSSGFTQIATVGANVTSYTSTGLSASTVYYYNVRAYNVVGDSAYANTASGQTLPGAVVPPNAPSGLATGSATSSSLTLTWTDNSSNETGFKIEYSSSSMLPFTQIATVGPNVTTYVVTGLSASTVYRFRVRAYNTAGDSDYSNTASGSPTAGSQTVTLAAAASNCVSSFNLDPAVANTVTPNCYPTVGIWSMSNAGGDYSNTIAYASAVQFNTSSLSGKTIESATLNLEARSPPVGYYQRNFRIGAIASSWSASTLTWNKMKSFLYYNTSWMSFSHPTFSGQDYPINLKAIVQNWANGTYSNYGIGFESVDYTVLWNRDSLDQYDFYIPTLTVTYH